MEEVIGSIRSKSTDGETESCNSVPRRFGSMTRFLFDVNVASNTHRAPMSISWVNHSQFVLMSTAAMMAVTPLTKQIIKSERIRSVCNACRKRFQEMSRVQACRHELRSIPDHHQENLFAIFVDGSDLVKIDNTVLSRPTISM